MGALDNETTINPLYSLDLGSDKEDQMNKAFLGRISKNIDQKYKKSHHNHVFTKMDLINTQP